VSEENPRCSFCGKTKEQIGGMVFVAVKGTAGICVACVRKADAGGFPLAHCSSCKVENGKHEAVCPEGSASA